MVGTLSGTRCIIIQPLGKVKRVSELEYSRIVEVNEQRQAAGVQLME